MTWNVDKLTPKEKEIYDILVDTGCSYQEIADKLYVSITTIRKHFFNIFCKLEVSSTKEIIVRHYKEINKKETEHIC